MGENTYIMKYNGWNQSSGEGSLGDLAPTTGQKWRYMASQDLTDDTFLEHW